jgi:hypothetical protein
VLVLLQPIDGLTSTEMLNLVRGQLEPAERMRGGEGLPEEGASEPMCAAAVPGMAVNAMDVDGDRNNRRRDGPTPWTTSTITVMAAASVAPTIAANPRLVRAPFRAPDSSRNTKSKVILTR